VQKQTVDRSFLLGASCHSIEAAQAAERDGRRLHFSSAQFSQTPSKELFGTPQGTERLEQVCRGVSIPVLAIGGITLDNAESCLAAGATGIAAISPFSRASSIAPALCGAFRQLVSYPPPTTCGS